MADNLSAFIEAVAADPALQEKLNSVADADAVVAIAKEAGFVISAEEMEKMENSEEELNAEQLAAVAGGAPASKKEENPTLSRIKRYVGAKALNKGDMYIQPVKNSWMEKR